MVTYSGNGRICTVGKRNRVGNMITHVNVTMFLLAILCLALAFFMVRSALADEAGLMADYPCLELAGKTCGVNMGGVQYDVEFFGAPFGPGLSGKAVLSVDGAEFGRYNFETNYRKVTIEGFANFFYTGFSLVWIQGELIEMKVAAVEVE